MNHQDSRNNKTENFENDKFLIISDIHLGEDVDENTPTNPSRYVEILNVELASFIRAHLAMPNDADRWHLLVNGDMFDFTRESEPSPEDALEKWIETKTSLATEEEKYHDSPPETTHFESRLNLLGIIEAHRPLFTEIARFVAHGHRFTVIGGNHDAEFYFQDMQELLREYLVQEAQRLQAEDNVVEDFEPERIRRSISFERWFLACPPYFHIEHGHQYDSLCSFENQLVPLDHSSSMAVATPMSHKILPYFSAVLHDFSTHGVDTWTMLQWIKYAAGHGPRLLGLMIIVYLTAMWELLGAAGKKRRSQMSHLRKIQDDLVLSLSKHSVYDYQTLRRLDSFRSPPAEFSVTRMMNIFFLDRILLLLVSVISLFFAAWLGGAIGISVSAVTLIGFAVLFRLLKEKGKFDIAGDLRDGARRIAAETGVQYVVFGHSHEPELTEFPGTVEETNGEGKAYYINCGSWVTREIISDDGGLGMTFVELDAKSASLKKWNGTAKAIKTIRTTSK